MLTARFSLLLPLYQSYALIASIYRTVQSNEAPFAVARNVSLPWRRTGIARLASISAVC